MCTVYDGNLEQLMIENVDIVFFFSFWKVYTLTYVVVEEKEKHKKTAKIFSQCMPSSINIVLFWQCLVNVDSE